MASSSSSSPEISGLPPCSQTPDRLKFSTHEEVIEDLTSRFILNLPDEELASLERICFQVEQAHWFYEDFIREVNPKFPSLPLKRFSEMIFQACPLLHRWSGDHEGAFNHFMQYKTRVPVCGAIMLNDTWDKVVLVKGWKSGSGWGFPKGKINQNEEPHACAAREVSEETGYNLGGQISPDDVVEMSIKEQLISLYIVPGVPEDYPFKTKTRKEISRIEWFRLADLPTWKRNKTVPGKFYLISPFIAPLKAFINERKPRNTARGMHRVKEIKIDEDLFIRQENGRRTIAYHSHTAGAVDSNVQESSSQSSSADNGEPQTPSPLYSEPLVNNASTEQQSVQAVDSSSIDPHFARLLSALSSSANLSAQDDGKPPPPPPHPPSASLPSSVTPVPVPSVSQRPLALDWSMRGPRHSMETANTASSDRQSVPHPVPAAGDFRTSPSPLDHRGSSPIRSHHASPPPSATSATSSISVSQSNMSRRGSSATADISPYLTRPVEVPSSGKRLKQLALLEAVADESARMTPALTQRTPAMTGAGVQPAPFSMRPIPSHIPPPSASVPPPSNFPNLSQPMYANAQPYPLPQPLMHPPPPNGIPPPMHGDDPFTVRPRTSNAFRPFPSSFPSRHFNNRSSMSQAQLLGALAGNPARPSGPPQMYPGVPQGPLPSMMGPSFHPGAPMPGRMGPAPPALRVVPPHFLPGPAPSAGPSSAPAHNPNFNVLRGQPNANANLLSILNAGGPGQFVPSNGA